MLFVFNAAVVCWVIAVVTLLFAGTCVIPKKFQGVAHAVMTMLFYAGGGLFVASLVFPYLE